MTGDHHGPEADRATLLVRVMDEILGAHSTRASASASPTLNTILPASRQGTSTLTRSAENLS
jgi:hypothetical protein